MQLADYVTKPPLSAKGIKNNRESGWTPLYMTRSWSINAYTMRGRIECDGGPLWLSRQRVVVFPPGCQRQFYFDEPGAHTVAHIELPEHQQHTAQTLKRTPLVLEVGPTARAIHADLDRLAHEASPAYRCAIAWHVLWQLATIQRQQQPSGSPQVDAALRAIRKRLTDASLQLRDLADAVGCSSNHLGRQFRAAMGCGVMAYVIQLRVETAVELLRSTDLPVRTIAEDVGIPDVQHFNKTMRRVAGASPTAVRQSGRTRDVAE